MTHAEIDFKVTISNFQEFFDFVQKHIVIPEASDLDAKGIQSVGSFKNTKYGHAVVMLKYIAELLESDENIKFLVPNIEERFLKYSARIKDQANRFYIGRMWFEKQESDDKKMKGE